jgi:AraC-like DNA-binding protein
METVRRRSARRIDWPRVLCEACRSIERGVATLDEVSAGVAVSTSELQRQFSRRLGISPKAYRQALALHRLARGATRGRTTLDAVLDAGFETNSVAYAAAGRALGTAPRVIEVPIQLEAKVEHLRGLGENSAAVRGRVEVIEVRIVRVHIEDSLLMNGEPNRIDPDKWRPLIMSFQEYYGLTPTKAHFSDLGRIPERLYRSPDVDAARGERALARTA